MVEKVKLRQGVSVLSKHLPADAKDDPFKPRPSEREMVCIHCRRRFPEHLVVYVPSSVTQTGLRTQKTWDNAAMGNLLSALARREAKPMTDLVELHARLLNLVAMLFRNSPERWLREYERKRTEALADHAELRGLWVCPFDGCSGRGVGYDIHPAADMGYPEDEPWNPALCDDAPPDRENV